MSKGYRITRASLSLLTRILGLLMTIMSTPGIIMGADTELTRQTMKGLNALGVLVEEIQPNIKKYAHKAGITKEQLQAFVEKRLQSRGIRPLSWDDWLKTPGRPALYVVINTHNSERYWYSYDIRVELQQVVMLETNPAIKTFASTWSIGMTGTANIGNLSTIKDSLGLLLDRFLEAHRTINNR